MTFRREDVIGKRRPIPVEAVSLPGMGECFVRKISASERVRFEYMMREHDGKPLNWQARLAVLFIADADGNRIFTDADADAIGSDPACTDAIELACKAGDKFNAMRNDDHEEAKKNSEPSQSG